tara:strand:- start:42 stop:662 length:621 start_codon:yes stop_codon:yes gene_type:complete
MKYSFILTLLLSLISSNLIAKEWDFDVILNDEIIGKHSFKQVGKESHSLAKFKFNFMFMSFSYEHDSKEAWNEDCLKSIVSKTNDDGEVFNVDGGKSNGKLKVSLNGKEKSLPECIMTFAYWNPKILDQKKLMNSQDAEWLDVVIKNTGIEAKNVRGQEITTHHYIIQANKDGDEVFIIDVWYDDNMSLVGLRSPTPIGNLIYKLI